MRSVKITLKKRKTDFAIGFWWQILDGKGGRKELLNQARKLADDFPDRNYNCLVARKQQFGLGSCESAKIKRLPSLACALVERSLSTWIGMFCLSEELWWVCAVSKKTIVAEGDQYFSSRTEAEAHLKSLKSMSDWDNNDVICETVNESMEHFDGLLRISEKVQTLAPQNRRGQLIAVSTGVVFLLMGWLVWHQVQQERLEEQRRLAALEATLTQQKHQKQVAADPAKLFHKEWKETVLPSFFATEFLRAVRNTEPYTLGWKLKSIIRNDEGIYMSWLHQQGAQFTVRPGSSILGSRPELAEITIAYPLKQLRPKQGPIHRSEATARLYELTRVLGAKLNLNWKQPEIQKLGKATQITAPWIKGEWKLSSLSIASVITEPLFNELDTIPCLVLSKIDLTDNQCRLEGQIYASY